MAHSCVEFSANFFEPLTWAGRPSIETISAFSCKLIDFKHREEVSGEDGKRERWHL